MTDTEAQASLRKNIRETLESTDDPSVVLGYAFGAASACWDDLSQAGTFRTDLMEVIFEETSKRLGFATVIDTNIEPTDDGKTRIYGEGLDAWIVYELGYHTCGGYGPESGYMHELGCGLEPLIQMKNIKGIEEWLDGVSHNE